MDSPVSHDNAPDFAFSPEKARQQLTPLDWANPAAPVGELLSYARFYGINFAETREGVSHGIGCFDAAGFRIAAQIWKPETPRGTVLVCHGYFDHVGIYKHIIDDLLAMNLAVVAYDLPGHGLSSGAQASIRRFASYRAVLKACLEHMEGNLPLPWSLVAQSTGGAIAMDFLLHLQGERSPFEQVVLLAPLVRPVGWGHARWLQPLLSPFRDYIKRVFTENSGDPEFLDFLQYRDPLQSRRLSVRWVGALRHWLPRFRKLPPSGFSPVVIQGDRDGTVDWQYNLDVIRRKFAQPEIHMLEGAQHQLVNETASYRERIRRILRHHLLGDDGDDRS